MQRTHARSRRHVDVLGATKRASTSGTLLVLCFKERSKKRTMQQCLCHAVVCVPVLHFSDKTAC